MASGSSGWANSGSKGFDFASDDILCSYDDFNNNQDSPNGAYSSDPAIGLNSTKDFNKSRMTRSSVFPATSYSQPEESFNEDVAAVVEKSMKKYADNLMRFLEGISSRLSQLELYCYNLDKSIGEMRSGLVRDHGEADSKLTSLEKHLQEVHRSVQILRDKQELADTQKELAKLHLVQKESSSSTHSSSKDDKSPAPTSNTKKDDNIPETHNQQLALALPHQVAPQQQPVALPSQAPPPQQTVNQQQSYYLPVNQLPPPPLPAQPQHSQGQYLTPDSQYRTPQMQEVTRMPQPAQSQVNQPPQYQQWPPQQVTPAQQPQLRPQPTSVYPPYNTGQSTNLSPETLPTSMSMQMPAHQVPLSGRGDVIPYGYQQPPPPQQVKKPFGPDGYAVGGPHQGSGYMMMYDGEGSRAQNHPPQQSHYPPQGVYPPQAPPPVERNPSHPQYPRNHPYNELTEKLVNMGFRGHHVAGVIQRMEESGQPVDFNSVLDRLNVHSSGGSQRGGGW